VLSWLLTAALAQAPDFHLTWTAPEGCPQRDEVLASVQRKLKRPPDALDVRGTITLLEGVYRLELESSLGRREIVGPSCVELAEAGALIVALLLDPMLLSRPEPEAKPPPPEPAPPPPVSPPLALEVGVAGVADRGALPSVAAGWHALLALDYGALRLEAFGGTFASQAVVSAAGSAELGLDFDVALRPCWNIVRARARPLACAALVVGRTSGRGLDVDFPLSNTSAYAAGFLGVGVAVDLFWRLGLLLHLEGGMPLIRTVMAFQSGPALYITPLFLARGELALTARFW
jgi:hypothetical protein